jgi:glucosamine 6-phosphate synthetase-like amidotransferase/phosphosugar isomerase protein
MHSELPDTLVAARQECPLIVGLGDGETFIASAIPAFLGETRTSLGLKNGEIVTVDPNGARIIDSEGNPVDRDSEEVTWGEDQAEKGGYETFMLKEIYEQADSVAETITDRLPELDAVDLSELELSDDFVTGVRRIVIVACGTSYHAGLVGRYAIEQWARVPVEMDIASEYRYRDPVVGADDLVVGITQSGETADTLAAMRLAQERGATVLAITNVMGSQATRDADTVLYKHDASFFLYLGRTIGLPVCLEGALKLKEISYIPTDAYAAGEMKHGPIALLDESTPVVCVATDSPVLDKVLSNAEEVKVRGAEVIAIATEGNREVADVADQTVFVPQTDWVLQPILAILPLQLLAYHIARINGLNVDQPRNLAKTVTVE